MALSRHSINKLFEAHGWHYFASKPDMFIPVARAIADEVRKQDEALIQQMLEALENTHDVGCNQTDAAIAAANKRLGEYK